MGNHIPETILAVVCCLLVPNIPSQTFTLLFLFTQRRQHLSQLGLIRTRKLRHCLVFMERHKGGYGTHGGFGRRIGIVVDIHFTQGDLVAIIFGELFVNRLDGLARTTPRGRVVQYALGVELGKFLDRVQIGQGRHGG